MNAAKALISKNWRTEKPTKTTERKPAVMFEQLRVIRSEDLPQLLTTKEAAGILRLHYKTVEECRHDGTLKFKKIRGRFFTTPEWIAQFIEAESGRK